MAGKKFTREPIGPANTPDITRALKYVSAQQTRAFELAALLRLLEGEAAEVGALTLATRIADELATALDSVLVRRAGEAA